MSPEQRDQSMSLESGRIWKGVRAQGPNSRDIHLKGNMGWDSGFIFWNRLLMIGGSPSSQEGGWEMGQPGGREVSRLVQFPTKIGVGAQSVMKLTKENVHFSHTWIWNLSVMLVTKIKEKHSPNGSDQLPGHALRQGWGTSGCCSVCF